MTRLLTVGTALFLGCILLHAVQWPYKLLAELLAEADLVVVGQIESENGRIHPPPFKEIASLAYVWNSNLKVRQVLKGIAAKEEIAVHWDEIRQPIRSEPNTTSGASGSRR